MTDAFENLFSPHDDHYFEKDKHAGAASSTCPEDDAPATTTEQALQAATERPNFDARQEAAEKRRQEFRAWLLHRVRHSNSPAKTTGRAAAEERRIRRMERLEERLAAAQANRAATLAELQRRAAATSHRREGAVERAAAVAAERTTVVSERLEAGLVAAESRRLALREAERERLRAEHELVFSRLATSQERAVEGAERQRSRLEARLRTAADQREARLARRAARAAGKVERARQAGALSRELQQQEAESRRQALEEKLESARRRRQDLRTAPTESTNTATSGRASPTAGSGVSSGGGTAAADEAATSTAPAAVPAVSAQTKDEAAATMAEGTAAAPAADASAAALVTGPSQLPAAKPDAMAGDAASHAVVSAEAAGPAATAVVAATVAATNGASEEGNHAASDAVQYPPGANMLENIRRSLSSRRLQQGWRRFVQSKRTTRTLAEAFVAQGVTSIRLPHSATTPSAAASAAAAPPARERTAEAVDVPARTAQGGRPVPAVVIGGWPAGAVSSDGGEGDVFDGFARALRSPMTIKATQALMRRLEQRLSARVTAPATSTGAAASTAQGRHRSGAGSGDSSSIQPTTSAAAMASPPAAAKSAPSGAAGGSGASSVTRLLRRLSPQAPRDAPLERYPPRVLLCAFMVVRHPEVVFSGSGAREAALAAAARDLVDRFETLLERIIVVHPDPRGSGSAAGELDVSGSPSGCDPSSPNLVASPVARGMEELMRRRRAVAAAAAASASASPAAAGGGPAVSGIVAGAAAAPPPVVLPASPSRATSPYMSIGFLLVQFDESWLRYLDQFVAWKGADAASLEAELVRCAAALETSMLRKCRGDPLSERVRRSSDLQAVIAQVAHDQALLRERVGKLGGEVGLRRLEDALEAARRTVAAEIAARGGAGSGSASVSATASEVDTTDVESPVRRSPSRGAAGAAAAPTAPVGNSGNGTRGPVLVPSTQPPPVPNMPSSAPSASLAASPPVSAPAVRTTATSAPIAVPERPSSGSRGGGGGGVALSDVESDGGAARGTASGGEGGGGGRGSGTVPLSASPRSPGALSAAVLSPSPPLDTALVSNAAMVHEMLLGASSGAYRLPVAEAEAAWDRAVTAVEKSADGLAVLPPGPSPEELQAMAQDQLIRAMRSRTSAIADCAFWDSVTAAMAAALQPPGRRPPHPGAGSSAAASSSSDEEGSGGREGADASTAEAAAALAAQRLAAVLAPLLSEIAGEVASVVINQSQAAALRSQFSEASLRSEILGLSSSAGAAAAAVGTSTTALVQRALPPLERLAALLVAAGAPVRETAAVDAHAAMRRQLAAALAAPQAGDEGGRRPPPPPPLAAALGRSLRLLAAQVKLLKVDAANGRLQAMAASLPGDTAVSYLRSKFAAIFRLPSLDTAAAAAAASAAPPPGAAPLVRQALPRTLAWLRRSQATGIEQYIRSQGVDLDAAVNAAASAAAAAVPANLRTGRLRQPPAGTGSSADPAAGSAVPPVIPIGPAEGAAAGVRWRWVVRCGVAALVSSDTPAVGPGLAETLLWDGERLHAAQNQFQQLVVVTAGLLLVSQLRATTAATARAAAPDAAAAAAASAAAATAWGPANRAAAARRLLVVVADPGMKLPELTSELAALAGVAGDESAEARLRSAFMSVVDPSSAAFRSLKNALAASLLLYMALGTPQDTPSTGANATTSAGSPGAEAGAAAAAAPTPSGPAAAVSMMLLGRVGASGLTADMAALGKQLLALCAVNEAVHADVYDMLYHEILREERQEQEQQREAGAPGGYDDG